MKKYYKIILLTSFLLLTNGFSKEEILTLEKIKKPKSELEKKLDFLLTNLEHTFRTKNNFEDSKNTFKLLNERPSQIKYLSNNQQNLIYLMLNNLKEKKFRNKIGEIIKRDIEDGPPEHGGSIIINQNNLEIIDLQSYNNNLKETYYFFPKINLLYDAKFHFHADIEKNKAYAGPGSADIITSKAELELNKKYDEFIITSLEKGKFNVDYIGGDLSKNKNLRAVDLGNYTYE